MLRWLVLGKVSVTLAYNQSTMWYRFAKNFEYEEERVLSEKDMGAYILKEVETTMGLTPKEKPISLTYAISKVDGCYIGDEKDAEHLIKKGIQPERAEAGNNVCSIGYCSKDEKWYGWSHRAIHGFGIGDKAETSSPWGDSVSKKKIKTLDEAKQAAIEFADSVS